MQNGRVPLSELLRPRQLSDLTIPQRHVDRLQRMVETGNIMNMLFYGGPGLGKTSAARVIAESTRVDAIELNGSSLTGIDAMRNRIEPFATSMSFSGGVKFCFIDEADYLSKNAQASLRHLIENSWSNCRFLFTVNDVHKLIPAIQSRLMTVCFEISPSDTEDVLRRLRTRYETALDQCGIEYGRKRLNEIIGIHFPDLRAIANRVEYEFCH
jgi:DNA polymerase III delta prime subunit